MTRSAASASCSAIARCSPSERAARHEDGAELVAHVLRLQALDQACHRGLSGDLRCSSVLISEPPNRSPALNFAAMRFRIARSAATSLLVAFVAALRAAEPSSTARASRISTASDAGIKRTRGEDRADNKGGGVFEG